METKQISTQEYNVYIAECPSREAFEHIFSKWGLLVIAILSTEPIRFGALRRKIDGISEKMLSQTLQILEKEGLVIRKEWAGLPPKVEYTLSDSGLRISSKTKDLIQCLYDELMVRSQSESDSE